MTGKRGIAQNDERPGNRWSAAAIALLVLGAALRFSYAFPTHHYDPDADALLTGTQALSILKGHTPVFYSDARLGALESYLHAPVVGLLGPTRAAIAIAPLTAGVLTLVLFYLFACELLRRRLAPVALLFMAFPSPSYLFWTYMPNGYGEVMLLCIAALWLGLRTMRAPLESPLIFFFGLVCGIGLWTSIETLNCSLPAAAWILLKRPGSFRFRFFALGLAGLVLGASPWLAYNVMIPLASIRTNYTAQPAGGIRQIASNSMHFLTYDIPALLFPLNPEEGPALSRLQYLLLWPARIIVLGGLLLYVASVIRGLQHWETRTPSRAVHPLYLPLTAFVIAALNIVSAAGSARILSVRFIMPLFFVTSAALAIGFAAIAERSRVAAAGLVTVLLMFYCAGYAMPGTPVRARWTENARLDERLLGLLTEHGVAVVSGSYWDVYGLNYLSGGAIRAVPLQDGDDYYRFFDTLDSRSPPCAFVSKHPFGLASWVKGAGLPGEIVSLESKFFVFIPDPALSPPPREMIRRVRAVTQREDFIPR